MKVAMKDRLYFHDLPPRTITKLNDYFRFKNPAYSNIKRFSPTGGRYSKVPKYVHAGEIDGDVFMLPRSVELPEAYLPKEVLESEIADHRITAPVKFPSYETVVRNLKASGIILNAPQRAAVKKFDKLIQDPAEIAPGFLLKAGTGVGKTIAMLLMARSAVQRTLNVTHRELIYNVWLDDIRRMYANTLDVRGLRRTDDPTPGKHITVAMLQTLHRRGSAFQQKVCKHTAQ